MSGGVECFELVGGDGFYPCRPVPKSTHYKAIQSEGRLRLAGLGIDDHLKASTMVVRYRLSSLSRMDDIGNIVILPFSDAGMVVHP